MGTMANQGKKPAETDSGYLLKLIMYFLIGAIWVNVAMWGFQFPVGFLIGLVFARHEHFRIDRKVEYAVLLIAMALSFASPVGLVIAIT